MVKIYILFSIFAFVYSESDPKELDWRTKGAILPVPEKSECGSHSGVVVALDTLSALIQIKTGKLFQLSRQQIYDCSDNWCPCGYAGNVSDTYTSLFVSKIEGIDTEESYPYTGKCEHKCNFNKTSDAYHLRQYEWLPNNTTNDENSLEGLLQDQPVAINVNSRSDVFQNYQGGILDDPSCNADDVNHNLLLVGYGTENNTDFWIARNNWGTSWGEKGYIRLVRGKQMCGVGHGWTVPMLSV